MSHRYFPTTEKSFDVGRSSARGGIYTVLAQILNTVLMLISTVIMARWLTPADYGVVVFATVFTGFAQLFTNAGFELPTIQSKTLTEQKVSNLFWLSMIVGLIVSTATIVSAPLIASFLNDDRQVLILLALAPMFLFSALSSQHRALMLRNFQNLQLSFIEVIANITGVTLGIYLAILTSSYWSLIVMLVSVVVVRSLLVLFYVRWLPKKPRNINESRKEAAFGANVTLYNIINYVSRSFDNFLIGWLKGYEELGAYDRAYKILLAPIRQLNAPLTNITLAALSKLTDDPPKYKRTYLTVLKLLLAISMPIAAFSVIHKELVIGLLLGPDWAIVIPIFGWLGIAGLGQSIYSSLGWLYISQGRSKQYLYWGFVNCAAHVIAFSIGIQWGALGIAISYCIVFYTILLPAGFYLVGREGPVSTSDMYLSLKEPSLLCIGVVASTWLVSQFIGDIKSIYQLVLLGFVTVLVYSLYFYINRDFFKNLKSIIGR